MLVLVLILVVIALALVLAGLFLHIVALAWASVGISLLASLVLLYDWWQTRTAVRAGRQGGGSSSHGDGDRDRSSVPGSGAAGVVGGGAAGIGAAGPDAYGGADMEPATQVLPVVPPTTNAAEETVVMPVVAPSGSAGAPSGDSRSGGNSSLGVTGVTVDEGVAPRSADGGSTAVDPSAGAEPGAGGDPATTVAAAADGRTERPREAGSGATRTPDATEVTSVPPGEVREGATQMVPSGSGAPGSATGTAADGAVTTGAADGVGAGGAAGGTGSGGAALAGAAGAGAAGAAAVGAFGTGASGAGAPGTSSAPPDDGTTRTDRASGGAGIPGPVDEPTSVAGAVGGPAADERTRVQQAADQPVDMSGEAPEEPRDPAHAALAARLPDEVVVIDEHPRYHVQACPSLPGRPVIPLPVSEAVDLGFTPCGWCSPNRVLSERHPAEAR